MCTCGSFLPKSVSDRGLGLGLTNSVDRAGLTVWFIGLD